ncbi:MAG TPA: helix-turn-helix transcriptional regulator [Kofleriaceae bacterium]|nr:helix-turn-helix transcriptional regulator [Kofleriaceae bacterium]
MAVVAVAPAPARAPWQSLLAGFSIATPPVHRIARLPDGTAGLLFRMDRDGTGCLMVLGPRTRPLYKQPAPFELAVHAIFRPGGAYPFLGVPVDELTDRVVPARDLWGARADRLLDDLLAPGPDRGPAAMASRRATMSAALAERCRAPRLYEPASAAIARAAVRRLDLADTPIRDLAADLRISARNLRRAFSAAVGVTPKLYARIARFQRALAIAASTPSPWAEVARATGFADQSHLAGEFRALAGLSPSAFTRDQVADHLVIPCHLRA